MAASGWLMLAGRGDGHSVLVLPGLFSTDVHTSLLRTFLRAQGFDPHPWGGGLNLGRWNSKEELVLPAIRTLNDRAGAPVSVIGASMGGVFAREAARRARDRVRSVITLCSPVSGPHRANHVWPWFELLSGQPAESASAPPPPVPSTSIYSRSDGVLAWQSCVQPESPMTENIEIDAGHLGMAWHPLALYVIADRLAQPAGLWNRFLPAWPSSGCAVQSLVGAI